MRSNESVVRAQKALQLRIQACRSCARTVLQIRSLEVDTCSSCVRTIAYIDIDTSRSAEIQAHRSPDIPRKCLYNVHVHICGVLHRGMTHTPSPARGVIGAVIAVASQ